MLWVRISIRSRCTTLCDKVCQWLATGRWFSPDTPVSSTNKTGRHYIYKWNIVGSAVKHHTPTIQPLLFVVSYHEIRILRIFSVSIFYCLNIMQIHVIELSKHITIWLYIILTTGFGNNLINAYINPFPRYYTL
jgi:hypothetical protein